MKKLISIALLLALAICIFASCTPSQNGTDTSDETTVPEVTSPEGFEDVTAPPEDTTAEDKKEDTTAADTTADIDPEKIVNDAEEAVETARAWLGETDPDTGYKYAFSYDGSMIENDTPYFRIRVSWYIEDQERYSLCGYLLVSLTGEVTKYSW